jgi:WD repeat-containing protein 19
MDLKHWADALKLAETLDPDAIATICKEHGAMLEMTGAAGKRGFRCGL